MTPQTLHFQIAIPVFLRRLGEAFKEILSAFTGGYLGISTEHSSKRLPQFRQGFCLGGYVVLKALRYVIFSVRPVPLAYKYADFVKASSLCHRRYLLFRALEQTRCLLSPSRDTRPTLKATL